MMKGKSSIVCFYHHVTNRFSRKWTVSFLLLLASLGAFAQNQLASVDLRMEVREYLDTYSYKYQFVYDPSHPQWKEKQYFEEIEEKLESDTLTEQEANDFLEKLKALLNKLIEQHFKEQTGYDGATDAASIQAYLEGQLGGDFAVQLSNYLKQQAEATPEEDYFVAVMHCEECGGEGSDPDEPTTPSTLNFLGGEVLSVNYSSEILGSPHSYAKVGSCVYLVYRLNKETNEEPEPITFPDQNVVLPTGGSFLGIMTSLDLTFVCNQLLGSWGRVICEEDFDLTTDETYANNLFDNLEACLNEELEEEEEVQTSDYVTSFDFDYAEGEDYNSVLDAIREKLQVDFLSTVKLAVNIRSDTEATRSILSKGLSDADNAEISLDIMVNEDEGKAYLKIDASDEFLSSYVAVRQADASRRGIEVDMEEMRQQVLSDLEGLETHGLFADFCQSFSSLFSDQIGTFVEVVQTTQKASKTVWNDAQMSKGHWWSGADDRGQWPAYAKMPPIVAGPVDGLIEEAVGIPVAIRSIYGIMTDEEQSAAFKQLFTKDGMSAIVEGIGKELDETLDDDERLVHAGGKTVVMVASIFFTGGITKTGKGLNMLDNLTRNLGQLKNFKKLSAYLGDLKGTVGSALSKAEFDKISDAFDGVYAKVSSFADAGTILSRIDNMVKWIGPTKFSEFLLKLDKLRDVPGLDKVLRDLTIEQNGWKKYVGAKFVVDYVSKKGDDFISKISSFEKAADLKIVIDGVTEVRGRVYDMIVGGVKYEFKNWAKFYPSTIRSQFIKDLADVNLGSLDEIKWVFNKTSGMGKIEDLKPLVLNALKKADGSPIDDIIDSFDDEIVRKLFPNDKLITEFNYGKRLVENLSNDDVFRRIFEVAQ